MKNKILNITLKLGTEFSEHNKNERQNYELHGSF